MSLSYFLEFALDREMADFDSEINHMHATARTAEQLFDLFVVAGAIRRPMSLVTLGAAVLHSGPGTRVMAQVASTISRLG
jgi:hypothetical protein